MAKLSNTELHEIVTALKERRRISRTLEGVGHLSIDRHLPFLVVFRETTPSSDEGARLLATTEASYLISTGGPKSLGDLRRLIRAIAWLSQEEFGIFLILEIWPRSADRNPIVTSADGIFPVGFRLFSKPENSAADTIIGELHKSLRNVKIGGRLAQIEIPDHPKGPAKRPSFVFEKATGPIIQVGLEIEPCWRDGNTGQLFPGVIRSLRRQMSKSLRRSLYHFIRQETTQRPRNFNVLGRRQVRKAVWEIDKKLDQITSGFDFLICLNPINTSGLWKEFKRSRFEKTPTLRYRPLPMDVSLAKRKLFAIPIEKVEDPSLEHLFRQKQDELDRQLTMLRDRGTSRFLLGAYQLYGRIDASLIRQAEEVLERVHGSARTGPRKGTLHFKEIRELAEAEIAFYAPRLEGELPKILPSNDLVAGLTVSGGDLFIDPSVKLSKKRAAALIQHEVGTHMLTFLNGRRQPLTQLKSGLAAYEELQEGLAVFAEFMTGGLDRSRLRGLAGRVLAAESVLSGAGFIDTFRHLCRYGFESKLSFSISLRVHRGGGYIKDFIYLKGFDSVLEYVRSGKDLSKLYEGKIALKHVEIMDELRSRGVVLAPLLLPRFLTFPDHDRRLATIKKAVPMHELVND